jgi:hypothetical protein
MKRPYEPEKYIVDGMLRLGRRRPSLLCGKPESGKSTLALQLATATTKGAAFLGRPTLRSEVFYWSSEETQADLADSLRQHGYDATTDARLYFNLTCDKPMDELRFALDSFPEIRLVIIETLDDFLNVKDLKENSDTRRKFEEFDQKIMRDHTHRASFLLLHHLKKRETDSAGDAILGATVLRGRTDSKLYLKQVSDEDPRRLFHATVRRGVGIPQTLLQYDPRTGKSVLGNTLAQEQKQSAVNTDEKVLAEITEFFTNNPDTTFKADCLPTLNCNSDRARRIFNAAARKGQFQKQGSGKRGDPFTYRVVGLPTEEKRAA